MNHQVDRFGLSPKWLWQFARGRVIIGAGVCVAELCQRYFDPRAQAFFGICKLDSVKSCGLTMRAADGGYAPRFLSFFVALSFFRFEGESTLPPTAANASR